MTSATKEPASRGQRRPLLLGFIALVIVGLIALFFFLRHGEEFTLRGGATAFTIPKTFANGSGGLPVEGTLYISNGGCLAVKAEQGDMFLGLPAGSHAGDSDGSIVPGDSQETGADQALSVGDVITGGGGYITDSSWKNRVSSTWSDIPASCLENLSGYMLVSSTTTG